MTSATRLLYEVHPKPSNHQYGSIDGAYASYWTLTPIAALADREARGHLEELGWDVEALDSTYWVTEESCPIGADGREHFEQVQVESVVIVLHTWPVGAPDDD